MTAIGDYKARVTGGIRDSVKTNTIKFLTNNFTDSPSYYSILLNGSTTDSHIVDDSQVREQKLILTQSTSPQSAGDNITWNGEIWLSLTVDNMGGIYYRGVIRECFSSLKWKNSGEVVKEVYFTSAAPTGTNFGVQEGKIINLGNERRQIIIQSNADTLLLRKDQRFIFDNRAWKTTAIDGLTDGLIYLTVDEDTINPTDNISTRIANDTGVSGGGLW